MGKMKYIFRILACESDVVVRDDVSWHSGDGFLCFLINGLLCFVLSKLVHVTDRAKLCSHP